MLRRVGLLNETYFEVWWEGYRTNDSGECKNETCDHIRDILSSQKARQRDLIDNDKVVRMID